MSESQQLYVVITDFDGWQQTRVCLEKLRSSTFTDFRIIVVDHGTSDETASGMVDYSSCIHLRGESDLWWTGATNLGIQEALKRGANHVMLLNNDCYVDESTLAKVMAHFDGDALQVVAPVQRDVTSGEVLVARAGTCFTLGFPTFVLPPMRGLPTDDSVLLPTRLIVGGRGAVVPADVFDKVGTFDETALPHYGADHDFYLRCRKQGIPLFIAPGASVAIDDTRTTAARNLGAMTWSQFRASLRNIRSHRNIDALRVLFRRYYPLKFLYPVGLGLNLGRYLSSYCIHRIVNSLRRSP